MNLSEYMNQSAKCRIGSVQLQEDEVQFVGKIPYGYRLGPNGREVDYLESYEVLAFGIIYCKLELKHILFTMDEHGNPKKPSVFRL